MSGDVQPRKRKDKNKKKKEDDVIIRNDLKETKEPTPVGVHPGAMGPDDIHLHVHKDHGVGGNWCVKVVFFSLLTILLGIAALILLENRGVSDVDTPVTESRFQEYFEGWVEEKPESHDEHDHIVETLNNAHDDHVYHDDDDGHDDHESQDGHSGEVDEQHNDHDDDETEEQSNEVQSGDKNDEVESNEDEGIEADARNETDSDEDGQDTQNSGDDENDENQIEAEDDLPELVRSKRGVIFAEPFNEDNDDTEEDTINPFNDIETKKSEEIVDHHVQEEEQHSESNNEGDDDEDSNDNTIVDNAPIQDENDDSHENFSDVSPFEVHVVNDENVENSFNPKSTSNYPINQKPEEEEEEDDGSFEDDKFFENDSGEDLHLEKLSKQEEKTDEPEVPQTSSLTVKLIIGLALVGVAAQVFARRSTTNDDDNNDDGDKKSSRKMEKEESYDELSMKRRLTIADDEVAYDDECDEYEDEYDGDEGDEVEYDDDDDEEEYEEKIDPAPKLKTFEQFDSVYRAKSTTVPEPIKIAPKEPQKLFETASKRFEPPIPTALLAKSEPPKPVLPPLLNQNLTSRTDAFKKDISPVTLTPPKQPSPAPQKQLFTTQPKQPSPTPQKQPSPTPPPKQPSPIPPPKQPSPTPLKSVEPIPTVSKLVPDAFSKPPPSSVFPPYHPDDGDDDDDGEEEYGDEDEEEYSGDEDEEEGEEDEEDISDVDDSDLLKRLDEKYGKLPDKPVVAGEVDEHVDFDADEHEEKDKSWTNVPTRSGPQSVHDELEGEINEASNLVNDNPKAALNQIDMLIKKYQQTPELLYWKAISLDRLSGLYKSNEMLDEAIQYYEKVLEYEPQLNDTFLKLVGERCIKRIRFRGTFLQAIPVHEKLINRFAEESEYQNQLAVTYLLLERLEDAKVVTHKVLQKWNDNGFAQANYGLILKLLGSDYEEAAIYLKKGIASKEEGTNDGRFYYHLGDALVKLQKSAEAREIFKKGAELKLFLSENQRSLHNVERLKSRPFWTKQESTYETYLDTLQRNWNIIRQEGLSVLNENGLFTKENEHLQDTGLWKQFHLFMSGRRLNHNCEKTPITCKLIDQFPAAKYCRRGQVKFSVMHPDTHVFPHCGPTNCRIRAHLGLTVPPGAYLRVNDEIRTWKEGEFLIFDDSFEHEVWHNGTSVRMVLIVDIWHPDLTTEERAFL